jgi:uncharacterized transporter YbjL
MSLVLFNTILLMVLILGIGWVLWALYGFPVRMDGEVLASYDLVPEDLEDAPKVKRRKK